MNTLIHVAFQQVDPSPALESVVRDMTEQLEPYCPKMTALRAIISRPTHRHQKGNPFQVRLVATVPGHELVATSEHDSSPAHDDAYIALRDTFHSLKRQVQDLNRSHKQAKRHRAHA